MTTRFHNVNEASRFKTKDIGDTAWENHKTLIEDEVRKGNSPEKISALINDRNIPGFKPNGRQIRHRLKYKWHHLEGIRERKKDHLPLRPRGSILSRNPDCNRNRLSSSQYCWRGIDQQEPEANNLLTLPTMPSSQDAFESLDAFHHDPTLDVMMPTQQSIITQSQSELGIIDALSLSSPYELLPSASHQTALAVRGQPGLSLQSTNFIRPPSPDLSFMSLDLMGVFPDFNLELGVVNNLTFSGSHLPPFLNSTALYGSLSMTQGLSSLSGPILQEVQGLEGPSDFILFKLIIFVLDNNLFDTMNSSLRESLIDEAKSLSWEMFRKAALSLATSNQEIVEKAFVFFAMADNRNILKAFVDASIQLCRTSAEKAYCSALLNGNIGLIQYLTKEHIRLAEHDPIIPGPNYLRSSAAKEIFYPTVAWCQSSLEIACSRQDYELVKVLLAAGASPTHRPAYTNPFINKRFPIHLINPIFAAIHGMDDFTAICNPIHYRTLLIKPVLETRPPDSTPRWLYTPSVILNIVKALVDAGANVNCASGCTYGAVRECPRFSPINEAASQAYPELVCFLLEKGSHVHNESAGCAALLSLLVNQLSLAPETVLDVSTRLIAAGIDLETRVCLATQGNTLPFPAPGSVYFVHGDPFATDESSFTAMELAVEASNIELANLLHKAGAIDSHPVPYQFLLAIRGRDEVAINSILDSEIDLRNPLNGIDEALRHGLPHLVEKLLALARGTSDTWPGSPGCTIAMESHTIETLLDCNFFPLGADFWSSIEAAANDGNLQLVKRLLALAVELCYDDWEPPLHFKGLSNAINACNYEIVDHLLESGIGANFEAVTAALGSRDTPLIRRVLQSFSIFGGFDKSLYTGRAFSSIDGVHFPTIANLRSPDIIRLITYATLHTSSIEAFERWTIRHDAVEGLNMLCKAGSTPNEDWMKEALESKRYDMLQALIEMFQKLQVASVWSFARDALLFAIEVNDITGVRMLLSLSIDVLNYSVIERKSVLAATISAELWDEEVGWANSKEILDAVLDIVTDLNCVIGMEGKLHYTPLLVAIDAGKVEFANTLIKRGADVNLPPTKLTQRTPIQAACASGNMAMFNFLLSKNADIHAPAFDIRGATALQFASMSGHVGIVYSLLSLGADVNAPRARLAGRTALEGAAEHGRVGVLELLLDPTYGIKLDGEGERQYNGALRLAAKNGHKKATAMLEMAKANGVGRTTAERSER